MLATNTRPRARARKRNGLKGAAKMLTRQPQTGRGRLAQSGQSAWLRTKLSRVQILQRPLLCDSFRIQGGVSVLCRGLASKIHASKLTPGLKWCLKARN